MCAVLKHNLKPFVSVLTWCFVSQEIWCPRSHGPVFRISTAMVVAAAAAAVAAGGGETHTMTVVAMTAMTDMTSMTIGTGE